MLTSFLIIGTIIAWFGGAVLSVYAGLRLFQQVCPACFAETQGPQS